MMIRFEEDDSPFFDKYKDIRIKKSHLEFWDQQGKFQCVTFHLADSIPADKRKELLNLKESFLKLNPYPWDKSTEFRYHNLIGRQQEKLLHNGYGSCILKDIKYRNIVEDSLLFYNEEVYNLESYVIMPNHVHLLIQMNGEYLIDDYLERIKRFSATKINKLLNLNGIFWVKENYCRIIRSYEHLKTFRTYIRKNPIFLKRGEFTLRI